MPDTAVYQDVADTFDGFVNDNDPLVASVLKGHLAIEELLMRILDSFVSPETNLDDARLTFHQKRILSQGLACRNVNHDAWVLVAKLNKLRNDIGHRLTPIRASAIVDEMRTDLARIDSIAFSKISDPSNDQQLVCGVVNFCIGFLGAYLREQTA